MTGPSGGAPNDQDRKSLGAFSIRLGKRQRITKFVLFAPDTEQEHLLTWPRPLKTLKLVQKENGHFGKSD